MPLSIVGPFIIPSAKESAVGRGASRLTEKSPRVANTKGTGMGRNGVVDKDVRKIRIRAWSGPTIVAPPAPLPPITQVSAAVGENCARAPAGEDDITPASQQYLKAVSTTGGVTGDFSSKHVDKSRARKSSSSATAASCGDLGQLKQQSSVRAVAAATDDRYAEQSTSKNHQHCRSRSKVASTVRCTVTPSAGGKSISGSKDGKGLARTHSQQAARITTSTMRPETMHSVPRVKPSKVPGEAPPATTANETTLSCGEICKNGYDIYGFRDPRQAYKRQQILRLAKADIEYVKRTKDLQRAENDLQRCKMQHAQAMNWSCWANARVQSASQAVCALPVWEKEATAALEMARLEKFNSEDTARDAEGYLRLSRSRLAEASKSLLCDKVVAKKRAELALRRYDGEIQEDVRDEPVGDSSAALDALEEYCKKMETAGKAGVMHSVGINLQSEETTEQGTVKQAISSATSRKRGRDSDTATVDYLDGDSSTAKGEQCFHRSSRRPKRKFLTQREIEEALRRGQIAENAIRERIARRETTVCAAVNIPTGKEDSLEADKTENCPHEKQYETRALLLHAVNVAKFEVEATQRDIWELSKAAACASLALDMARADPRVVTATAMLAAAEQALETAKRNKGPARLWMDRELDNKKKAHDWEIHVRGELARSYERWKVAEIESEKAKMEKNAAAAAVDALPEEIKRGFRCTPHNMFNLVVEESYYKDMHDDDEL